MVVKMNDDVLFLSYMFPGEEEDAEKLRPPVMIGAPTKWFFPRLDIENDCPELAILAESLQELTGLVVRYTVTPEIKADGSMSLSPYAEELVITTFRNAEDGPEFFDTVTCSLGCFGMLFFRQLKTGVYLQIDPVKFTEEIREGLFLKPCEANFDTEDEVCQIKYVANKITSQFPPLLPQYYIPGTEQYDEAKRYWDTHKPEAPDYWSEIFGGDGAKTRILDESNVYVDSSGREIEPIDLGDGIEMYTFEDEEEALKFIETAYMGGEISEGLYQALRAEYATPTYTEYVMRFPETEDAVF